MTTHTFYIGVDTIDAATLQDLLFKFVDIELVDLALIAAVLIIRMGRFWGLCVKIVHDWLLMSSMR